MAVDMVGLKLDKLPDRKTVKITFTASAELNKLLADYASGYEVEYGQRESVNDLIPHILEAFIKTDRGFQKKNKMPVSSSTADVQIPRASDRV